MLNKLWDIVLRLYVGLKHVCPLWKLLSVFFLENPSKVNAKIIEFRKTKVLYGVFFLLISKMIGADGIIVY